MAIYRNISLLFVILFSITIGANVGFAQEKNKSAHPIDKLLDNIQTVQGMGPIAGQMASESSKYSLSDDGHLRSVAAPPFQYFPASQRMLGNPDGMAREFISDNAELFGTNNQPVDFNTLRIKARPNNSGVRLQQVYDGVPVFAAEVVMQVNEAQGIEYVMSDIMRNEYSLSVTPIISLNVAEDIARDLLSGEYPGVNFEVSSSALMVYSPSVIGATGPNRLVWKVIVSSVIKGLAKELVLVDASNGQIALNYTLIHSAKDREIYDANNNPAHIETLARSEGDPATGISDVDSAYDYLGDSYDFYSSNHARDSFDDLGSTLIAHVRRFGGSALWNGEDKEIYLGEGFAIDDVIAHEMTHGVTGSESGLIYIQESGAINESFSDIWGEFIDLGNGSGTDTVDVRWLLGEDLSGGAIRDMSNPPAYGDPDRYLSSLFYKGDEDYGGVHTNSGVINKLAYLLTDGDTFNGQTVSGMGIPQVADLFYEVQTGALLTAGSDFLDLYNALTQAAVNLTWSSADKLNLEKACLAVEITTDYYGDDYEPDNSAATATAQPINTTSSPSHSINPTGDEDWISFTLNYTSDVTIETSSPGTGPYYDPRLHDTRMWLFNSSEAQIDYNDDISYPTNRCSRIVREGAEALPAGTYFVKVNCYYSNINIYEYDITLESTAIFDLFAGWNGVSCPGDPLVDEWSAVIAGNTDIVMVVEYDPTAIPPQFVMATNIEFGKSYFIGALNDTQIELEYLPRESLSLSAGSGWNPLGSVSCSIPASNVTSNPQVTMVVRWDNSGGTDQFVIASTIDPGVGYMVGCTDNCTISLDCLSLAPSIQRFVMKPSWEGMLSVQTKTDHKKLVFGMSDSASDGADLYDRPAPPMLDVSDITAGWVIENSCFDLFEESFVRDNEYANWELSVELTEHGEISWGNLPRGGGFILSYDGIALDMHRERSLSLPIGKHTLLISANLNDYIPEKTELLASYPNPCNPETWIPYKLSNETDVRIMIYSSNGALVRSLDLGHRPAGVYVNRSKAAYWDGKNELGENVSSGIYFYALVTPEFSETRKLLILQ